MYTNRYRCEENLKLPHACLNWENCVHWDYTVTTKSAPIRRLWTLFSKQPQNKIQMLYNA